MDISYTIRIGEDARGPLLWRRRPHYLEAISNNTKVRNGSKGEGGGGGGAQYRGSSNFSFFIFHFFLVGREGECPYKGSLGMG